MIQYTNVKRVCDVVGGALLLPVLAIVSVIVVPVIRISDRGPALYASRRRGLNGTEFTMYKFRSMSVGAEDLRNPDLSTVTIADDPRVTKVGRVLRKSSLDELPQILNVLRGDMSFIGPRPNMTSKKWGHLTNVEMKRVSVRPGITGLSQATVRNSAPTETKYRLDCLYVDEMSFLLDVRILALTVMSVIKARNVHGPSLEAQE